MILNENPNVNYSFDSGNILIKDINIVDPFLKKEYASDILIENGKVKSIGSPIRLTAVEDPNDLKTLGGNSEAKKILKQNRDLLIVYGEGLVATSSFTDMHVHLREPGDEDEEDMESGIKTAYRSGITTLCCMPNTRPPLDTRSLVKFIKSRAAHLDYNILPVAAMTRGLEGKDMTDFGILQEAGAVALSDDGRCVQDAKLMYEIMKYSKIHEILLILHEEDYSFSKYGFVNEGYYSSKLGLDGVSSLSEELIIARDIKLAEKTGCPIHITHLSSGNSVEIIKRAKESGIRITCDVTPHHIFFNDSAIDNYDTNFKVNPPLRSPEDQQALIEGLKDGVIDAIASDHAPHLQIEKNTTFSQSENGTIGMETLFKAVYTKLCIEEGFGLIDILKLITVMPGTILGIEIPSIVEGKYANIVIIDKNKKSIIKSDSFYSKSSNSAFIGKTLSGEIVCTIDKGRIKFFNDGWI